MGDLIEQNKWLEVAGAKETLSPDSRGADDLNLRQLFGTVWAHKWLVLGAVIVSMVTAIIALSGLEPQYKAEALVMLENRTPEVVDFRAVVAGLPADNAAVVGEIQVLRKRKLAQQVIDELHLSDDPEFNLALQPVDPQPLAFTARLRSLFDWLPTFLTEKTDGKELPEQDLSEEELRAKEQASIVEVFATHLDVSQKELSRVISISFISKKARTATLVVNTLADLYILEQREAKFKATQRATKWLNASVSSLRDQVETSERSVELFRHESGLLGGSRGVTLISEQISELNKELGRATTERAAATARLRSIEKLLATPGDIESAAEVLDSGLIQNLRTREVDLQLRLAELSKEYGELHPKMRNVQVEMDDIRVRLRAEVDKIVKSVENEAAIVKAREASLQERLKKLEQRVADANTAAVKLRTLEGEAEANRQLLQAFLSRFKETSSQEDIDLQSADASIISRADVPTKPVPSRKMLIIAVTLVGSAFVGVLLAFLKEQLRAGFLSGLHVEQVTGVPTIGLVPMVSRAARMRDLPTSDILRNPQSAFAESMRSLYTSLLLSQSDKRPTTILIASSQPKEGKTTIAASLGRLQALTGQKVIVIDGDIRRPGIHSAFGIPRGPGLVDVVVGNSPLEEVIKRDEESGADVIPAGGGGASPPNVLASHSMDELLDRLAQSYELVIVDSAPLMAASDARILSTKVDRTVFVLRWARTKREVASIALKQLVEAGSSVGVLLTMVDLKENTRYGYGDSAFFTGSAQKYYARLTNPAPSAPTSKVEWWRSLTVGATAAVVIVLVVIVLTVLALVTKFNSETTRSPAPLSQVQQRPMVDTGVDTDIAKIPELLNFAEQDYQASRLAEPPGRNALERYRQVLSLEPGNSKARIGLRRLANHFASRAEQAMVDGKQAEAKKYLAQAESIDSKSVAVGLLRASVAGDKVNERATAELLARAAQQVAANRLSTPAGDNAVETYQAILQLQPGHNGALNGLEIIKQQYVFWLEAAIQKGNWKDASIYVHKALKLDPDDPALAETLRKIAAAKRT